MLDNSTIPQVPTLRILGIHFDPRLTWRAHIDIKINSCTRYLSWFRRLVWTPGLSRRWRRTAYIALLRSRLCYGNVVYGAASQRQLRRLSVYQNNCLRGILNVRLRDRVPIAELQGRTGVESIGAHFGKCQLRYITCASQHVPPIREDIEAIRNYQVAGLRGPIVVMNRLLGDEPLPAPVI